MKRVPRPSKLRPTVDLVDIFRTSSRDQNVVLTKGEDFDCAPSTAAQAIREEWARLYGSLSATNDGDDVILQIDAGKAQRK